MVERIEPSNFKFNDEIGDGSTAIVYKEIWNGKFVAVKKFLGSASSSTASAFKRELETLAKINHNNVVKFYGYWDKRDNTFLVNEFMEGGSLYAYIEDKKQEITWKKAMKLIKDIVGGMIYLHNMEILHLDLKSLNILLNKTRDLAKISDFGLSKISSITSLTSVVNTKIVMGTTRWMAPEISQGKLSSRKSDVWSFGCILIEFATREIPFKNMTDQSVFLMLQNDKADVPLEFDFEKTPKIIAKLISSCLKRNKDERRGFESIKEKFLDGISDNELKTNLVHQSNIDKNNKTVVKTVTDLNTKLIESSQNTKIKNLEDQIKDLKLENEKQAQFQACARNYYREPSCNFNIMPCSSGYEPMPLPMMQPFCVSKPASFGGNYIDTGKTYKSNGSANGSKIYEGPRGGLFRVTDGGSKVYIKK